MSKKWRELKRTEPMQKGDCLYDKTGLKHIVGLAWSGITIKEYEKFWGTITSGYRERPKRPSLAKLVRRLPTNLTLRMYINKDNEPRWRIEDSDGCLYVYNTKHLKAYLLTLPES